MSPLDADLVLHLVVAALGCVFAVGAIYLEAATRPQEMAGPPHLVEFVSQWEACRDR